MSQARINVIKGAAEKYRTEGPKSVASQTDCAKLRAEEKRELLLAFLHCLSLFTAAFRKFLKVGKSCPHCGNVL